MSKSVLDAGAGIGDIGAALFRVGATITAMDCRQEHLSAINKRYPGIKTIKADFEKPLGFSAKFDVALSIATLCHIENYQQHLKDLCVRSRDLILETAVCDSDDPEMCIKVNEDKNISNLSFSGNASRPSAANIEKILSDNGMYFIRLDMPELNHDKYIYNWEVSNTNRKDIFLRRLWVCSKSAYVISEISKKYKKVFNLVKLNFDPEEVETIANNEIINSVNIIENNVKMNAVITAESISYTKEPDTIDLNKVSQSEEINQKIIYNYNDNNDLNYQPNNKKFVIVIPSYKNEKWAEKNILSALNQNYSNFRVIFTDDCSSDNTFEVAKQAVESHKNKSKATLIKNNVRCGALENLYNMIHSCDNDEIIITLDGDDWLPDNEVLNKLNKVYQGDVWMTYGQYKCYPQGGGHCKQIPDSVINSNNFRQYAWLSSHLRTFYTWLFKMIKKEDLMYNGKFSPSAWDMWIMFPLLEMSGKRSKFISDILYIYNLDNPINDHKVDRGLQANLDKVSRNMPKYNRLLSAPVFPQKEKTSIGLLLIATGKYDKFIQQLVTSADKFFFNKNNFNVKYFIFTDSDVKSTTNRQYQIINIKHRPFPYASMDRFKHFSDNKKYLSEMDYLYYVDVDCKFVNNVEKEVLGNLVGVRHCGYFNGNGTFESNPKSVFYAERSKYKYYFGGGFSGGKSDKYLQLSEWCSSMIDKDLSNNIVPLWHDETALNKYYLDNQPDVVLSPSYHYPENDRDYIPKWRPYKFEPKILLLDKNHKEIRS